MPKSLPTSARIEVFRPGTFTPMKGSAMSYSAADLRAMSDAYDFATAPAPIVVGHPTTDAPAYGWVKSFEYDATAERLFANVDEMDAAFAEAVRAGRFKKVSMCMHRPEASNNPTPGAWYPKHIGFLGGAAPAVSGLKNVSFAAADDGDAVTFAAMFGERGFEETASILRSLRDWLIGKHGLEDADSALPSYRIEWLAEMEVNKDRESAFAAPKAPAPELPAVVVPPVTEPDAAFTARQSDLDAREAAVAAREAQITQTDNASFVATLVADGRLIPALEAKVVAILNAQPSHAAVSFAEGEAAMSPGQALRSVLADLPKVVSFGRVALPDGQDADSASFAADGAEVDADQLALHSKALTYQREHPETPYLDAVRAVS